MVKYFVLIFFFISGFPVFSQSIPSFKTIRDNFQSTEGVLLDRNGIILHEFRADILERKLAWCALGDVSSSLLKAILASEDKNFFTHDGVDWRSFAKATFDFFTFRGKRGASTISMQLASILKNDNDWKGKRKSILQKLEQVRLAKELEKNWSKNEIFEAYLNLVSFRGELVGISAASRGLFGKYPHGLNEIESIILSVLIRSPNSDAEKIEKRSCLLSLSTFPGISCKEISLVIKNVIPKKYNIVKEFAHAFHAAKRLERMSHNVNSRVIESSLDFSIQNRAADVLARHLISLQGKNVKDGAVLIVENSSGDVLAYVGNSGKNSTSPEVDAIVSKRQAGSTLKPFLYALAFEKKIITPSSYLEDSPLDIPVFSGIYRPSNYEKEYHGLVQANTALASSLNVPAVRVLNLVGVEAFFRVLSDLKFRDLHYPSFYGPSLALGSLDVTLWDLTAAYRTIANQGIYSDIQLQRENKIKKGEKIFTADTALKVSEILADREFRSLTFGLENPLSAKFPASVKTGTSKDMRDNWCIGFSDHYTVGVWVGNFSGEPMWNVSGVTGAAPVWRELMDWLGENYSRIDGKNAEARDKSQKQDRGHALRISTGNKIIYPAEGSIFALDPDIPEENQKLFFEAENFSENNVWSINGVEVGNNFSSPMMWQPKSGKYVLQLIHRKNGIQDSVRFEVR